MHTRSKLGLLSLAAIFMTACSSTPNNPDGGDGGTNPGDGGGSDAKSDAKSDGGACAMLPDIAGTTDMTVTVQEYGFGMAMPIALAGADVRIEQSSGDCAGYIDGTTDNTGVAHIKVDPSKGPFDITAAKAGYTAVSVLNQAGALTTPIVTNKTNTGSSSFQNYTASGSITGKTGNGQVQLDAYWWATVVTTMGTFNTQFGTAVQGQSPPLIVTGLEADSNGNVISAMQNTSMSSRPKNNLTGFNMQFSGMSGGFSKATVTVNWPSAGVLKGSDVTQVGDPVSDMHLGKGAIVVKENQNPSGQMFIGVADTVVPTNNQSTVIIQAGTGAYTPDYWQAAYRTNDTAIFVRSNTLNNGGMFNVGTINKFDAMGMSLDDTTFETDSMGYDASEFILVSQDSMQNGYAAWSIFGAGAKLGKHKIPHLPKNVKLADITDGGSPDGRIVLFQYQGGSTAPWAEYNKPVAITVVKSIGSLDPGSRP